MRDYLKLKNKPSN